MNVVGYVRQSVGSTEQDSTFAQSERIRRWAADTSNELISVCQDHHPSSSPFDRPGYNALLDIARSERADAVVLANLAALSPDVVTQEVMLQDLRDAGVTIIATEQTDIEALQNSDSDRTRMLVRDVVSRVAQYQESFGRSAVTVPPVPAANVTSVAPARSGSTEVVVELRAPTA